MSDLKVLVTGRAGYIGCVLVPLLLARGYQVRVVDNLMCGGAGLLSNFRNPRFEFLVGDIRDERQMAEAMKGSNVIIHLAAIVGFPACRKYPDLAQTVNVDGTKVVAKAAGRQRCVLFASTGSNYGALVNELCTEETPLKPLSLYGKTKTAAEQHLFENCNTIAYRLATAFGVSPRMRFDLQVNHFVYTALQARDLVLYEAHSMRTFIHVYDIARSFLFGIENASRMQGQVFNVGSEEMNYSKAQVCEMIRRKVDYYLHCADVGEDEDRRNYVVSYQKIKSYGYNTTINLEQGIDELVRAAKALEAGNLYSNV
jgi:nucleoside-diphosphate-sugar epimerase